MKRIQALLLGACVGVTGFLQAAPVITAAGSATGVTNWFTAGYGDHAYGFFDDSGDNFILTGGEFGGQVGYVPITSGNFGEEGPVSTSLDLEDPGGGTFQAGTIFQFGLSDNTPANLLNLNFNSGTPPELRIGILVGTGEFATGGTDPSDFPQSLGVGGVTQSVANPGFNRADWYFFDVTNISAGDSVTVSASRVEDTATHLFSPINGVAIQVIPEPGTLALVGITLGGLLLFRRRR